MMSGLLMKIKIKETLNLTNELKKPSTKIEQRGRLNKIKLVLFQGAKAPKRNSNSKFNGKHKLRVKRHKQQCVRHVSFKKTAKKEEKQLLGDVFFMSFIVIIYFGMAFIFAPSSYIYRTPNNGKENVLSPPLFFIHICMILQVRPVLCIVAVTYPRVPAQVLCKCYLF